MATQGGFDPRNLKKVLADLERNLSPKEMRKVVNKGTKAGALIYKRAIVATAPVPGGKIVKIRAYKRSNGGLLNGHHVYVGPGRHRSGAYVANDHSTVGFDIPVVWAEWGTYNQRDLSRFPYTPATLARHSDAYEKNALKPPGYGIRPTHFIRRAIDANAGAATKAMFDAIENEVRKFKVSR